MPKPASILTSQKLPVVEQLEQRILYSADALTVLGSLLVDVDANANDDSPLLNIQPPADHLESSSANESTEVVFIDSRVPELDAIVADIQENKGADVQVIILDQSSSGLDVIESTLMHLNNVDSVHLISHTLGSSIRLGADLLSAQSFNAQSEQIALWGSSLNADADILVYGCDLGSSIDGLALMNELAKVTGADVAVSDDDTGHRSLDADWDLEVSHGSIDTQVIVSHKLQDDWTNILSTWDDTNNILVIDYALDKFNNDLTRYTSIDALIAHAADPNNGDADISLREAIVAANSPLSPANVTIELTASTPYEVSLNTPDIQNLSHGGDLDIQRSMSIEGTGSGSTLIQSSAASTSEDMRIFEIHNNSTAEIYAMTLNGGDSTEDGGAIRVENSNLVLNDVHLTNNKSGQDGGAIYASNSLVLMSNSLINYNEAAGNGGGIMLDASSAMSTLVTVAVDNNKAVSGSGGGIYTNTDLTISDLSSISRNEAIDAGGLFVGNSSNTEISGSNITNNEATNGGGLLVQGLLNLLDHSTLDQNIATDYGGGAAVVGGVMNVFESSILSNEAKGFNGGGIHMDTATLHIDDSIIAFNKATETANPAAFGFGGGIYVDGDLTLTNSTVKFNEAVNGAGISVQITTSSLPISNTTFYKNTSIDDGGAIHVNNGQQVDIEHSTIADNVAEDTGGAIDADGGAIVRISNSIIAGNVSNDSSGTSSFNVMADGIESGGFNVVTDGDSEPHFLAASQHNDIVNRTSRPYVVDARLDSNLSTDNGSYSEHLKLLTGSDAIDAASGFTNVDAFGITSNEFPDVGAVEYQLDTPSTKVFFIDEDVSGEHAIYRMNEDGSALQQVVEQSSSVEGYEREFYDVAYDPKSRHLFFIRHVYADGTGIDDYQLFYTSADGRSPTDPLDYLTTGGITTGNYSGDGDYASLALSVGETAGTSSNVLFVSQNEIGSKNSRIVTFEIEYSIDGSADFVIDAQHLWQDSFTDTLIDDNVVKMGYVDGLTVVLDNGTVGNSSLFLGDSGTQSPRPDHFTKLDNGVPTLQIELIEQLSGNRISNDVVRGVAYNQELDRFYFALTNSFAGINLGTTPVSLDYVLAHSSNEIGDIQFDPNGNRLWYTDSSGVIGYLDAELSAGSDVPFIVQQRPVALALATLTTVNTPPRPGPNPQQMTILENNAGTADVILSTSFNWTDIGGNGATEPSAIEYEVTQLPTEGQLLIDGIEAVVGSTFTQETVDSLQLSYSHNGEDPSPNPQSDFFSFWVSDAQPDSNNVFGTFEILINEVNDLPELLVTNIEVDTTINENSGVSVPLVSYTTSDVDGAAPSVTVNIRDQFGAIQPLATDDGAGNIVSNVSYDHELTPYFDIEIIATDEDGAQVSSTTRITIDNVNEAPVTIALSGPLSVPELTPGASIGTITTTDPDVGDTIVSYEVVNIDDLTDDRFHVDGGVLTLKPGREIILNNEPNSTIRLDITATDSGTDGAPESFTQNFVITIENVNEAPYGIALDNLSVPELTSGATVGMLTTSDPDAGDTHTYSVINVNDSLDDRFHVVAGSLQLKSDREIVLNDEPSSSIELAVTATDAGVDGVPETFTQNFLIVIDNVNQAPVAIALSGTLTVPELTSGATIGMLTTTDPDATDIVHEYSVVNANNSTDVRFEVVNSELRLKSDQQLVLNNESSITLLITATDSGGEFFVQSFVVGVTNINEAPTDINLIGQLDILELNAGVDIGTLTTQDNDSGDNHIYTILEENGSSETRFEIIENLLKLKDAEFLRLNNETTVALTILTTDSAGASYVKQLTFNVLNVNESPTGISIDGELTALELTPGLAIGTLSTIDPDSNDTIHSYTVVNTDDLNDTRFEVVGSVLKLKESSQLDFNIESTIDLQITSTDPSNESVSRIFTLTVTDINQAPTDITLQTINGFMNIPEQTPGIVIGAFSTVDPDNADLSHTYSVVNANNSSDTRFEVINGELKLKEGEILDLNIESTIVLYVVSTDSSSNSFGKNFIFEIENVNRAPIGIALQTADGSFSVPELTSGFVIGTLSTEDPDTADVIHTYSVENVSDPSDQRFEVVDNVLQLKSDAQLDIDTEQSITLQVSSVDSTGDAFVQEFTLTIVNVNEEPIFESVPEYLPVSEEQVLDLSQILVSDPDNDTLLFTVTLPNGEAPPTWLTYDQEANQLSVINPPESVDGINLYFIANDQNGGRSQTPIFINIVRAPEPAAALPTTEPRLEPESEPEPIAVPVAAEKPTVAPTAVSASAVQAIETQTQTEEVLEIERDVLSESTVQIDLAGLIVPLEQVNLVDIEQLDSTINSISGKFVVNQSASIESLGAWMNLSDAFSQPSNVAFADIASEFDRQREALAQQTIQTKTLIGSSFTVSSGLSVGYLLWLIRGGTLMGSVLSTLPAWRLVDPLPILGSLGDDMNDDDDSLESLVEQKKPDPSNKLDEDKTHS